MVCCCERSLVLVWIGIVVIVVVVVMVVALQLVLIPRVDVLVVGEVVGGELRECIPVEGCCCCRGGHGRG